MTMHATLGDKTVTVQVLRVHGKKMTLQRFKQVPVACAAEDAPTHKHERCVRDGACRSLPTCAFGVAVERAPGTTSASGQRSPSFR
jgi:hypothetical protein